MLEFYQNLLDRDDDGLVDGFTTDLMREEANSEERALSHRCKPIHHNHKHTRMANFCILFDDDLESRIKFTSYKYAKTKLLSKPVKRLVAKNRRMHSAPQSIKNIIEAQLSNSAKEISRNAKMNQKMIIERVIYCFSELFEYKIGKEDVFAKHQLSQIQFNCLNKHNSARNVQR
jgi:hypothetical protein